MTYYANLQHLSEADHEIAIRFLTRYVKSVLVGGDYLKNVRHNSALCPHLKKMYELYPDLKEKWENTKLMNASELNSTLINTTMKKYTVGETDDPCDLFMLTTEVNNSCMHISGRPRKSKGMLGHIMDGKIHPIVVKDINGKIVARLLLRLLNCEKKGKPVLVMDSLYTIVTSNKNKQIFKHLIESYCKKKAIEMKVDLLSHFSNGKKSYGELHSYGGPGAFEHLNPLEGTLQNEFPDCMTEGFYTLSYSYPVLVNA